MPQYISLFIEGFLSFLSPCILPLLPVYLGYLSSASNSEDKKKNRINTFKMTLCFVLGICLIFFLIAFSANSLMPFFNKNKTVFQIIAGFVLIFMALNYFGIIKINALSSLSNSINQKASKISEEKVTCVKAFLLGFLLTLSWTPCIGPILATVFVQAANANSSMQIFTSVLVFSLGFSLIFSILGLFTEELLAFLKKKSSIVKYTHIISGLIILAVGIYFLFIGFKSIRSTPDVISNNETNSLECCGVLNPNAIKEVTEKGETATMDDVNFILKDSQGNFRRLTDFKGKTTILSFSATWCGYCNKEWPEFNKLFNDGDTNVIVVVSPNSGAELSEDGIKAYMEENGYDFYVLYDNDLSVNSFFYVYGYPTTYFFDADGLLITYIPGYVDETTLSDIVEFCKTKDEEIFQKYN